MSNPETPNTDITERGIHYIRRLLIARAAGLLMKPDHLCDLLCLVQAYIDSVTTKTPPKKTYPCVIYIKIRWLHHVLWQLCCKNACPSPFYQCEAALNTICSGMKSTPRVEHYWPLLLVVAGIDQVNFWTSCVVLRWFTCWHVPSSQFKYKSGSDRDCGDLIHSPTEF